MKSRLTIISGVVALVSFVALLAGLFWMPALLRSTQLDEARLSSVEQAVSIVGGITGILSTLVSAISALLGRDKSASEPATSLKELLRPVTPDELIVKYVGANAGRFNWIDRAAVTPSMLYEHRRIAILGRMKIGKTREAAELIRRVLAEGGVPESQVFDLTTLLNRFDPDTVSKALPLHLDHSLPKIFYINDLPQQYKGKSLETLATAVSSLKSCGCCYIIFTARLDQMTPTHEIWMRDAGFYPIELRPLDQGEIRWLSYSAAVDLGLQMDETTLQEFVKYADGTPARTIMALFRLQGAASQQVGKGEASRYASLTLQDSWKEVRKESMENAPDAKYLFQALALLFRARITPYQALTLRLAYLLKLREKKTQLARPLRLDKALDFLKHYDIYLRERVFQFPDVAVEDLAPAYQDALQMTGEYLSQAPWTAKMIYPVSARELGDCFFNLAYNYYALRSLDLSLRYYRLAIRAYPADARMHYKFGNLLSDLGQSVEAAEEYRRALEINPQYVSAHNNLAVALEELGQRDAAIAEYQRALEINPNYAFAHNNLYRLLKDPAHRDQAITGYRQTSAEPEPSYEAPHHNKLGNLLRSLGLHEEAVTEYQRALELDPNYAEAHCNLGLALSAAGKHEDAVAKMRDAIELDPKFGAAHFYLGNILTHLGQNEQAVIELRKALETEPGDKDIRYQLAIVLAQSGKIEEALAELWNLLKTHPDFAEAHYSLAYLLEYQGQNDRAESEYRRALELDPERADVHYRLGYLLANQGQREQAVEAYQRTLELAPDFAEAHYSLGLVLEDLGQLEPAVEQFDLAIQLDPENGFRYTSKAHALRDLGRDQEADELLVQARERVPEDDCYNRACLEAVAGNFDPALQYLEMAIRDNPTQRRLAARDPDLADLRGNPRFQALVRGE